MGHRPRHNTTLHKQKPAGRLQTTRRQERERPVFLSTIRSAESAGDVVARALLARCAEELVGRVEFDQFAEIHEGGAVSYTHLTLPTN